MFDYPHWVTPSTSEYCAAPGCRRKPTDYEIVEAAVLRTALEEGPRWAVDGSDLCNWHHARFPRALNDLVGLWPDLERALYRKSSGQANTAVQTSGVSDLAQSWNPHVTEVMAEVRDWTAFLVRVVLAERPLPPAEIDFVAGGRTIIERSHGIRTDMTPPIQLATLARHHSRWLSGYPFLGPYLLADADELRRKAMNAISAEPVRRVGLKGLVCAQVVGEMMPGIDMTCASALVAILNEDNKPSLIVCAAHPHTHHQYTPAQFMEFTR